MNNTFINDVVSNQSVTSTEEEGKERGKKRKEIFIGWGNLDQTWWRKWQYCRNKEPWVMFFPLSLKLIGIYPSCGIIMLRFAQSLPATNDTEQGREAHAITSESVAIH